MNISCIRTYRLSHKLDAPFGFSQWRYDRRHAMLVEIVCDQGASGWGECYGPAGVCQAAVADFYAPRVLGLDPLRIDAIWHQLWQASLDFARGGVMMAAISGIDMALWDLKGRLLNVSVSELLGGRLIDRTPCYATGMYYRDMCEDAMLPALVEEAQSYAAQGFGAMKIKVGKNPAFDLRLIAAMRSAMPRMRLMADANHGLDLPEALRIGQALGEAGYEWFEEPLSPEHPEQFRQLHDRLSVPIAAGECEQTRYGFRRLLSPGGVDIAQPDLAYCGGLSEGVKIRAVASSLGVNILPHAWGTMLNLAAAAHFLATTYVEPGRAEPPPLMLEYDRTSNPLRDDIFATPLAIARGAVKIPSGPGLGVAIDPAAMKKFCIHQTETC